MKQTLTRFAAAAVAALFLAPVAQAQDITFTLTNNTDMVLMEFFAAPSTDADWGDDLLGADVLDSGELGVVLIADDSEECTYGLYFIFSDGTEFEDEIDICELRSYTLE